ncbi:UDP-N-acetylglucosamine 2-epimerase [Tenacibaculum sp.]|uniref:UDP-N-acetylglucosamine 2-epimerase n=1 Tax=Tenacibaculum sp. TaxID=1906242 RepID=UPI003D0F7E43
MKIGVLTSSRADYGIYKPLLTKLSQRNDVDLTLIVFGMHLQKQHGYTINNIKRDAFGEIHEIEGMPINDDVIDISEGYGNVLINFAQYWNNHSYDYVFALGDRFEMSAAVQAGIPFQIKFAHLHGGETTLGAIDNIYRDQITLASKLHFVSTQKFADRVELITNKIDSVHNVGALSLDGIENLKLPSWDSVREKFNIPDKKFILVTVHPETVAIEKNELFSKELYKALESLSKKYLIVITSSNADTLGKIYRDLAFLLKKNNPENICLIDSFGKENYFAAMEASEFLLGNTSSGILEAASFGKYVINLGDRQAGRLRNENVIDVKFDKEDILKSVKEIIKKETYRAGNFYFKENTADNIIKIIFE